MPFSYRPDVLAVLWSHGVQPTGSTRPELVHEFVSDLYRYELRRLRDRLLQHEFPKTEYYGRVLELRRRYQIISTKPAGWLSRGLEIVAYDPAWPSVFEAEALAIREALGPLALRIDHHGSTSIPGLAAKPVVDIQISVGALQPLPEYGDPLSKLGYIHVPHPDDSCCPFFHRPASWPHTHHVHVVELGGAEESKTLAFRDYLREHRDEAREYQRLKEALARRFSAGTTADREAYAQGKSGFVERIVALALRDGYPRTHPAESDDTRR